MENESVIPHLSQLSPMLSSPKSLIKAAFNDPEILRMAPYRVCRALISTEDLLSDEKSRELLELTESSFAMFTVGDKTLSWFEGRE